MLAVGTLNSYIVTRRVKEVALLPDTFMKIGCHSIKRTRSALRVTARGILRGSEQI